MDFIPTARNPNTTPFELWHGMQPDVSHLQPLGCMAYTQIPVESGDGLSKLDPQSIKGTLIGYFGWDAYKIYNPVSHQIYCSHDVIFEEGVGNKTLPIPRFPSKEESGTNTIDHVTLDNPDTEEDNGQYKGLALTHKHVPPTALLPVIPTPVPSVPVIHHSTHVSIPTQAIRESHASEQTIQDAQAAGEAWADDQIHSINTHKARAFHTDANLLPNPLNHWLPNSYDEAVMATSMQLWNTEPSLVRSNVSMTSRTFPSLR